MLFFTGRESRTTLGNYTMIILIDMRALKGSCFFFFGQTSKKKGRLLATNSHLVRCNVDQTTSNTCSSFSDNQDAHPSRCTQCQVRHFEEPERDTSHLNFLGCRCDNPAQESETEGGFQKGAAASRSLSAASQHRSLPPRSQRRCRRTSIRQTGNFLFLFV